jgi:hypothetical protein
VMRIGVLSGVILTWSVGSVGSVGSVEIVEIVEIGEMTSLLIDHLNPLIEIRS